VGTPGRVIDHLERESLKIDEVSIVVLDEADEMISMGFREDMETILKKTSESERNIWLFSATMSPSVKKVADVFLKEAQSVQVNRGAAMLSATVEQIFFQTQEKNKPEVLCKLIDAAEDFFGLVFCQTKALVVDLQRYLSGKGYQVECLHGDMNQREREAAMLRFRERQAKILVCTDVAARGLDVKDVSHVVNYSLPRELDSYVHRIGRTARSGKAGKAFSLVTPSHRHLLGKIEKLTKSRFVEGEIPTRKAIALKKVAALHESFSTQTAFERAGKVLDSNWLASLEKMDKEEIAARFITLLMPDLFIERERDNQPEYSAPSYADAGRGREGREGRGGYGNRRHRDSGNRSQSYSNRERPQRNYSEQKYSEKGSVEQNFSGQPSTDQGERRPYRKSDKPAHAKRPFHSKPWDKPKRDAGSESPSRGSENTFKGGGFRKKKFRSQKPRQ
jgi:ATP-dependent RNA helicase DeaD